MTQDKIKKSEEPTWEDLVKDAHKQEVALRNKYKKLLRGLINITGLFRHLDENTYWEPEDIVDIELTDDKLSGYKSYQHARVIGDKTRKLYMKTSMDEYKINKIDHYYVWQTTGCCEDDYYGYMLFPLKNGKYFKVYYIC